MIHHRLLHKRGVVLLMKPSSKNKMMTRTAMMALGKYYIFFTPGTYNDIYISFLDVAIIID